MARVLVTDGGQRAALATVRSLGRAGHHLFVCETRPHSLAGASRYCVQQAAVPDPLANPEAYSAALQELVQRWEIDTLIPISEPSILAVLPVRNQPGFSDLNIPFAPLEKFLAISDKAKVAQAATAVGISVPRQLVLDSAEDAPARISSLEFPIVLKPTRSVVEESAGPRLKVSVRHVADIESLEETLSEFAPSVYPVLAQERIIGPGIGVFLLMRGGEPRAVFGHRRLREKPPAGGVSVLRESVPVPEELFERSVDLLRRFEWEGVAMVEYKVAESTGEPYIMEINGRLWGSLQLAIDAGVDFPRFMLDGSVGHTTKPRYAIGVRSRWEWGDFDHLLARLRRSPEELALPPGSPGRVRAVIDFLRGFGPGNRNEILRLQDPRPFLRETIDWVRGC